MPSVDIKVDLSSLKNLIEEIKKIENKVRNKAVRTALNKGAKIFVKAARNKAKEPPRIQPRGKNGKIIRKKMIKLSKTLSKSIDVRVKQFRTTGNAYAIIGPKRRAGRTVKGEIKVPSKYAHLVEFGTAPHPIVRKNRTVKKFVTKFLNFKFLGSHHPGARPKPFMRPAYDQTRFQMLAKIEEILKNGIEGQS